MMKFIFDYFKKREEKAKAKALGELKDTLHNHFSSEQNSPPHVARQKQPPQVTALIPKLFKERENDLQLINPEKSAAITELENRKKETDDPLLKACFDSEYNADRLIVALADLLSHKDVKIRQKTIGIFSHVPIKILYNSHLRECLYNASINKESNIHNSAAKLLKL